MKPSGKPPDRIKNFGELLDLLKRIRLEIFATVTCIVTLCTQCNTSHILHGLNLPEVYPPDGIIATFQMSSTPDIRTELNEELSLFSDSAKGGDSTLWYERLPKPDQQNIADPDGYLRIHYSLSDNKQSPDPYLYPYVGVFADFSNPQRQFDISKFQSLTITLRAPPLSQKGECSYYFILCDGSVRGNGNYAWAQVEIDRSQILGDKFITITKNLRDFATPRFSMQKYSFDSKHVFRFEVKILGKRGQASSGLLDIDDIRFVQ